MKTLLKKYKKLILILILPYLFIGFLLVIPSGKSLLTPGGLMNVNSFMSINDDNLNDINTVYVYDYYPSTYFQHLITNKAKRFTSYDPSVFTLDTTALEKNIMGKISKNSSINNAIIYAYNEASKHNDNISINYEYIGAQIYYKPSKIKTLKIGDTITHIDNNKLSFNEFINYFNNHSSFTLRLLNGDEIYYIKDSNDIFTFYPNYEITETIPKINIEKTSTSGPSGGFMQALSIYMSLMNYDLQGLKIAGTGTIDVDGNIGRIGGTIQKIYTAMDNNVDYFFMPSTNLADINLNDYPIKILIFNNFMEAVNKINELFK